MFMERTNEKELLDLGPKYYSQEEYTECLKKLFQINRLFGFFKDTVKILKYFPPESTLLDIGCGGGLFILHLSQKFPNMKMMGTDISAAAINNAQKTLHIWQQKKSAINVIFKQQSAFSKNNYDIVLVTLVCHHLANEELISFLQASYKIANKAIIINDLHRHPVAYFLYKLISPILFRNRLIIHDGLISIRRGFTRKEWKQLLQKSDIKNYQLKWCFPFRWKLILWK